MLHPVRRRVVPAFVTVLTACVASASASAQSASMTAIMQTRIDSLVQRELRTRGIPGAAVVVSIDGTVAYSKGFGIGNVEVESRVDRTSVFEIASITKPMTATAIMMLVEEGKLGLDDPVSRHITGVPDTWRAMTVRHLLTHTSGLPVDAIVGSHGSALLNISTTAVLNMLVQQPLLFEPGERASYSDGGYFLLGMIIEKVSGQRYRDFMTSRLFAPLGMNHSSILDRAKIVKGHVPVYTRRRGELEHWRRDWQYELPSFFGVFSSAEDVALWEAALRGGKLIRTETLDQMLVPARLRDGGDALVGGQFYGLGWDLGHVRGRRIAGHSGASGVYLLRMLDEPISVIVFTNLDVATGPHASSLARRILETVNPELRVPRDATTDPDRRMTTQLLGLLSQLRHQQMSALLTQTFVEYLRMMPPQRKAMFADQMSEIRELQFVAADSVRIPLPTLEPTVRVLHYLSNTPNGPVQVSFDLTSAGKVAMIRVGS